MNTVVRRRPVRRSFDPFWSGVFDDLFNTTLGDVARGANRKTSPESNIYEQDDNYVIELAVPGVPKGQISINVEDDVLTIKADKTTTEENDAPDYKLREFDYSSWTKSYRLSEDVDVDSIAASSLDGVLTVTLSKKEETKPLPAKTIEIK